MTRIVLLKAPGVGAVRREQPAWWWPVGEGLLRG